MIARAAALVLALAGAAAASPDLWRPEWPNTDFARSAVADWSEILSGGPPRDGIPALDNPAFLPATEAAIPDREPVITLALDGAPARAYPLRYLVWHEIVNDTLAGVPVAITWCPLCNSALVFDRRLDGRVFDFGVTGKLRHSDMVMYDRQTESWWQQALGQGIVGQMTGARLTELPAWMESYGSFRASHPGGLVMAQPDWPRSYGLNPYEGYDTLRQPFLYSGEPPPHGIEPLARVVRVGEAAWPLDRLAKAGRLTEQGLTFEWTAGTASALDSAEIARGRDVGAIRVRDAQGRDVPHDVMFAFAFHAFFPNGRWVLGE